MTRAFAEQINEIGNCAKTHYFYNGIRILDTYLGINLMKCSFENVASMLKNGYTANYNQFAST